MTKYLIKNKATRVLACLCALLILCALIPASIFPASHAEPIQRTYEKLTTLTESQDITLTVWFDKELPDITFISPDGNVLPLSENSDEIRFMTGDEWVLIQIIGAAPGDWYIDIDPLSNTDVSYQLMGTAENIWIQYITVVPDASGRVDVAFLAELGNENVLYRYELCLSANYDQAGEILLREGDAVTGVQQNLTIDLREHPSYDSYVIVLYVYKTINDAELFDSMESDPFSYTNPNTLTPPDNIDVAVNLSNRNIIVDWSEYESYRYDGYLAAIYAYGESDPIYYGEFEYGENTFTQYIQEAYDKITVLFYGRRNGVLSDPVEKEILLDGSYSISILTKSPTASSQVQISMLLPDSAVLHVAIGNSMYDFTSDGSENTVAADLVNGSNAITAYAYVGDIVYYASAELYKDGLPPLITFFEPYDGQNYKDASLTIVGSVSDAVSLYLDDTKIEFDESGNFSADVKLAPGENKLTFLAEDSAGNRTAYTLYLYGDETITLSGQLASLTKNYLPLIIVGALSLAVIILTIVLAALKKKLKAFSLTSLIVFFILTTVGTLTILIWQIVLNFKLQASVDSIEFAEIVSKSPEEAYEMLTKLENIVPHIWLWVWLSVASIICLLITVLIRVLLKRKKARKKDVNNARQNKETPPPKPSPSVIQASPQADSTGEKTQEGATDKKSEKDAEVDEKEKDEKTGTGFSEEPAQTAVPSSDAFDSSGTSDNSDACDSSDTSGASEASDTSGTSEASDTSSTSEASDTSGASEASDSPSEPR